MARELSHMTQAEINALTPQQMMRFNNPLPEVDPEHLYDPESAANRYPKWLFGPNEQGTDLISILVESAAHEAQLEGDWRESPADWGIMTAPDPGIFEKGPDFKQPLPQKTVMELATKRAEKKAQAIAASAENPPVKRGPGNPNWKKKDAPAG